jgi:hypothetical protein
MAKDKAEAARDEFIGRCKIDPNIELYTVGLAERGITLYKQQVRALNLVYALDGTGRLKKTVGVIGGGAAGATAALGAATLGYEVHLFEQRPMLFHLQQGCDIRWLHPHIYEWPAPETDSPYAGHPLLNWQFGTAAEVAARLQAEWDKERRNNDKLQLTLHRRASAHIAGTVATSVTVRWDNSEEQPRSGEKPFDTVIVAVGFGVEKGVLERHAQSYWRNDSVNQPLPGIPSQRSANYFISGTGDGGLIDLLRVCVNDFNQGRILEELFGPDDPIIGKLRAIILEWRDLPAHFRDRPEFKGWLFDKYEGMSKDGLLNGLEDRLDERRRKDTVAILKDRSRLINRGSCLRQTRACCS